MTVPLLTLDTEHYKCTLVYTLTNRAHGLSFSFANAGQARDFLAAWYKCPIKARYAYELMALGLCSVEPLPRSLVEMVYEIWEEPGRA